MKENYLNLWSLLLITHCLQAKQIIAPGLWYTHLQQHSPKKSTHLLTIDPSSITIKVGIANNKCASSATVSDLSKKHNALAGINGGFFDYGCTGLQKFLTKIFECFGIYRYKAFPVFALSLQQKPYSLSHIFTGALAWNNNTQLPTFSAIQSSIQFLINNSEYPVTELNKRIINGPTLFTSSYDRTTPRYHKKHAEIVIKNNKILAIKPKSRGKTIIPHNGFVYVIPQTHAALVHALHIADRTTTTINYEHKDTFAHQATDSWSDHDYILAGTPLLIHEGQRIEQIRTYTSSFYTQRHPRTAIGTLKNGYWVAVVVDGDQKESIGSTMPELMDFMHEIGCVYALNLDGGSSSTMVINNSVINKPSNYESPIPVSNALLFCAKDIAKS